MRLYGAIAVLAFALVHLWVWVLPGTSVLAVVIIILAAAMFFLSVVFDDKVTTVTAALMGVMVFAGLQDKYTPAATYVAAVSASVMLLGVFVFAQVSRLADQIANADEQRYY